MNKDKMAQEVKNLLTRVNKNGIYASFTTKTNLKYQHTKRNGKRTPRRFDVDYFVDTD